LTTIRTAASAPSQASAALAERVPPFCSSQPSVVASGEKRSGHSAAHGPEPDKSYPHRSCSFTAPVTAAA
jgi:hypothetical protein